MEHKRNLDLEMFKKVVKFPALKLPAKLCQMALKKLSKDFDFHNLKRIIDTEDKYSKLFLLSSTFMEQDELLFPEHVKKFLSENEKEGIEVVVKEVEFGYKETSVEDMYKMVLPKELHTQLPGSYECVGHLAHLNLKGPYLPYKHQIAEIILLKHNSIKTVVNKVGKIDNVFRTFKMELLAGQEKYQVRLNESRCWFEFDFRNVYWNSRLQMEHARLIQTVEKGQVLCDMFAGVGPFAVPCARRREATVFANDLNPESFKYLEHNKKLNKIKDDLLKTYNMDARDFILKIVREEKIFFDVAIMNLPKNAIDFLDVFVGIYEGLQDDIKMPIIHCYCFSKHENPEQDVVKRVSEKIGFDLSGDESVKVYNVRDVSPKKFMLCISFRLPKEVAFKSSKKRKLSK